MRHLLTILVLCSLALGQATTSGGGVSTGSTVSSTQGAPAGGGGAQTGENIYCPAGSGTEKTEGVPTWGTTDGVAQLPTACMNTALTSTPSPGSVLATAAGDAAGFQTNLNNATCGQTITLVAGSTYTAPNSGFIFPAKGCDGSGWITIRTTGTSDPQFPAEGTRATPCIAGISNDLTNGFNMPGYPSYQCLSYPKVLTAKITDSGQQGSPPMTFASNADHYRFIGIDFSKAPGSGVIGQYIPLSSDPQVQGTNHIIFDRVLIHGRPWSLNSTPSDELQSGINTRNSQWTAVINSWIYDTYCIASCVDSQGIGMGTGAIQDGPFKAYNNLLATAAESFMIGGGGQGIGTPNTQNFEFRSNHSFKPLTWMIPIETGGFYAYVPIIKNLGEFKNGVLALLEGNVYENNWQGQSDQTGIAQIITPKNQNNVVPMVVSANGSTTVTRVSGGQFIHQCGNNPSCSPADATNCPPGGCVLEIADPSRAAIDNGHIYRFCNGVNPACAQTGDLVTTAALSESVPTSASINTNSCVPGDCPSCRVKNVTFRFNEIYNVIHGLTIGTGRSSHCLDESAGNDHIEIHDNLAHGLSVEMSNGSDPQSGSSFADVTNGQVGAIINNVAIRHNTVAIEQGNSSGGGGLGNQTDTTDIAYLQGLIHTDNFTLAPYGISHSNGSNLTGGLEPPANGGVNGFGGWQTQSCQQYYPVEAPGGIVVAGALQSFSFTPGLNTYFVTVNGVPKTLSSQTSTTFILNSAATAGDSITVRDPNSCTWTFLGNVFGTGMPGSGRDNGPYPTGRLSPLANNTSSCGIGGALTCLLDQGGSVLGPFTQNFVNWGTGRLGDFNLLPSSNYFGSATDAATRPATGKSPGADLTTQATLIAGVASATNYPVLTITTPTLTQGTHNIAYQGIIGTSAGASPYKSFFQETTPSNCGPLQNCGVLPSTSGIIIGRSGTVNGPFVVLNVSRSVVACGSAGTVACSKFIPKQTIVAGFWQVGQVVTLSNFENGTGSQANDATFNGTCTIRVVTANSFSCDQPGTGADTIASHQPNSFWQGYWKNATTYALNEQVVFQVAGVYTAYVSLQNGNHSHSPDVSPTFWQVMQMPPNNDTGAFATFSPITPGTYIWWMGARDGAFQIARSQITMVVN
jgi:hypothetical protein